MFVALTRLSIRTKLAAAMGSAIALVIGFGALSLYQLRAVNAVTEEIRAVRLPQLETIELIRRLASEHKLLATRRTQTTNFHHLAAIGASMEETERALADAVASYRGSAADAQEAGLIEEFGALWEIYRGSLRSVMGKLEVGEISAAHQEFSSNSTRIFHKAAGALEGLLESSKQKSQGAAARAQDVYTRALLFTVLEIIAVALCALAAFLWMSRNVTRPILSVSRAMKALIAGDEKVDFVADSRRHDEIGVLTDAVAGYREALSRSRDFAAQAELVRNRLQAAVANMPVGLSMFDHSQRLIICNNAYREIYQVPAHLTAPGTTLTAMFDFRAESGASSPGNLAEYKKALVAQVTAKQKSLKVVELPDGRTVSILVQPMADGGWVSVHEDITERRRAEERIAYMARHDTLTGLPNRTVFAEHLNEALRRTARGDSIAVLCLDLDRFKAVNDTLGHHAGDALLRQVAGRLKSALREIDFVARFGGDEFAIIQTDAAEPEAVTALARRLIETLSAPYDLLGHQVVIGASVGISIAPTDGTEAEVLLKNGDMALYRAKADGRGTFRFFEPAMDARMQARRLLELDLRRAVAGGEFEVFYQPIVNVERDAITSFEALLRWHHPRRGMVAPSEFIPLAEEIGLIDTIGRWVLQQACRDAARWPVQIKVSVNLSPVQFRNATALLEAVTSALALSALAPGRLELEITEGVLLVDTEATLALLHQLRALGVHIAMDDFGTGYSSLSYLRRFPFDRIKIDGSFIRNINEDESSLAIIRAVTGLGASLGIATTAEGVETEEQLERLRNEGCREIQGFLFSDARSAAEAAKLIASMRSSSVAAA